MVGGEGEEAVFQSAFVRSEGGSSFSGEVEGEGAGLVTDGEVAGEGSIGGVFSEAFFDFDMADAVGELGGFVDEAVAVEVGVAFEEEEFFGCFDVIGLVGERGRFPYAEEVGFVTEVGVAEAAGFGVPACGDSVCEDDSNGGGAGVGHGGANDVGEGALGFLEGGVEGATLLFGKAFGGGENVVVDFG